MNHAEEHLLAWARGAARWILALIVFGAAQHASALDPDKAVSQYAHNVWTSDDGLPSNRVRAIAQTADGYLWLGTQDGFARFDGVRFTVYDRAALPELGADFVTALSPGDDGALWVGTSGGGLGHLQRDRLATLGRGSGLASDRVLAVHPGRGGVLWVGTYDGLNRIAPDGSIATFTTADGLASNIVTDLAQDAGGALWIATVAGLSRFNNGTFKVFTREDGLPSDDLRSLHIARDGTLWVGTADAGVARRHPRMVGNRSDPLLFEAVELPGHAGSPVRAIMQDRDGNVWIASDGDGLFRSNADGVSRYSAAQGLSDDAVIALHEDREGNLWVGTGSGLDRLRDGSFTTYAEEEGLSSDFVVNVYQDRAGALWIGTNDGLNRLDQGHITVYTTENGLADNRIRSLGEDRDGNLWVGAVAGGLSRFRDGRVREVLTTADGLPHDVIMSILEDRHGGLWVGSAGGGLARYEDGEFTVYTSEDGLAGDFVFALLEDASGMLWIGTDKGLSRLRDGRIVEPPNDDLLAGTSIESLHEGSDGIVWIGTRSHGMFRMEDDKSSRLTIQDGLFSDTVHSVLEDERGDLWLSSNKGISRIKRSELDAIAFGRGGRLHPRAFGRSDGMKSSEANGGPQPAGWRTRDGRLWFATMGGVTVVDPEKLIGNRLPPTVIIESIAADERQLPLDASIRLRPGTRRLDIGYTATSLAAPERVRFRYRMEGFDDTWIDAGTARSAQYTNLPPGDYRFRVIAANDSGVWNEHGAALAFELLPWFYQTTWFYLLCAVLSAAVLFSLHHLRVAWLRAQAGVLEERHRIAREIHDSLAQGFSGIGLQIEAALRRMQGSPDLAEGHLRTAKSLVKDSLNEARCSVWALSSPILEEMNLTDALMTAAQQLGEDRIHEARVHASGTSWPLPRDTENHVLRIVQEAVSNAVHHGKAHSIVITLTYAPGHMTLDVVDDGIGFASPVSQSGAGRGFGLHSIHGRARAMRGHVKIHSATGAGTRVSVRIPRRHRLLALWNHLRRTSAIGAKR